MNSQKLLRLHDEPCLYFNEKKIHQALMSKTNAFMDLLERFYLAWQKNPGLVQMPKKQLFVTKGLKGDWRVMPCVIENFEGQTIKAVKVVGTNEEEKVVKDKITVGKALLLSETDNFVKGIFDVCALSSFRTAAISTLAYKQTSYLPKQKVGLIGTGRIGFYTAVILSQWLGIRQLFVYDANKKRLSDFKMLLPKKINVTVSDKQDLCRSCDALFLGTTSSSSLIKVSDVNGIYFISSVGADADNLSELDVSLLNGRTVVSESRQNICFGDMRRWHTAGKLSPERITELIDIIGRPRSIKQPVLFISTGTAIQDALTCQFLFKLFMDKKKCARPC